MSIISMVETLEYPKIRSREKAALDTIFSFLIILFPGPEKLKIAIGLRQLRPMSLGDSLIAATALVLNIPLATHNTKELTWSTNLNILDPLNQ